MKRMLIILAGLLFIKMALADENIADSHAIEVKLTAQTYYSHVELELLEVWFSPISDELIAIVEAVTDLNRSKIQGRLASISTITIHLDKVKSTKMRYFVIDREQRIVTTDKPFRTEIFRYGDHFASDLYPFERVWQRDATILISGLHKLSVKREALNLKKMVVSLEYADTTLKRIMRCYTNERGYLYKIELIDSIALQCDISSQLTIIVENGKHHRFGFYSTSCLSAHQHDSPMYQVILNQREVPMIVALFKQLVKACRLPVVVITGDVQDRLTSMMAFFDLNMLYALQYVDYEYVIMIGFHEELSFSEVFDFADAYQLTLVKITFVPKVLVYLYQGQASVHQLVKTIKTDGRIRNAEVVEIIKNNHLKK